MSQFEFESEAFLPDDFSGQVRLFPIPNLVMFPHVVQPLHIFEERYREMMEDALAGDGLIAMPVLKPGWEADYASRPPLEKSACLGRVVLHNKLPDGCYNLLLLGLSRIELVRELKPLRSFRQADAIVLDAPTIDDQSPEVTRLRASLTRAFESHLAAQAPSESLGAMLNKEFPLPQLTDLLAFALPLSLEAKVALLSDNCPVSRGELLLSAIDHMESARSDGTKPPPGYPPPFSDN